MYTNIIIGIQLFIKLIINYLIDNKLINSLYETSAIIIRNVCTKCLLYETSGIIIRNV